MIQPIKPVTPIKSTKNDSNSKSYEPKKKDDWKKQSSDTKENDRAKSSLSALEQSAVYIRNGKIDIDISKISSCTKDSMDKCESECPKYHSCKTIAYANDILSKYGSEHPFASILNKQV